MRTIALLLCGLLQLCMAIPAQAAPACLSRSLAEYIALGAAGCSFGGVNFENFSEVVPVFAGAIQLDASTVMVTPVVDAGGVGFSIERATPIVAAGTEVFEHWFGFTVSGGSGFIGSSTALGPPTVGGDGAITLITDLCREGSFTSPSFDCQGTPESQLTFATELDSQLIDADAFAVSSFFDVFVDQVIDGGISGDAELGPQLAGLRVSPGAANLPEPTSAWLVAAALLICRP